MSNKLTSVIIENPYQKSWGYRSRDALITLSSLGLWGLVFAKLYLFFVLGDAVVKHLADSMMLKVVLVGFVVTFLTFHCWAVYNQHRYTRYLKRQLRHLQQPTLAIEKAPYVPLPQRLPTEHPHFEHVATPRQATN